MIQRIKQLVKIKEGTNNRFAVAVGISPRTAEKMFSGKQKISLEFIEAILRAFPDVSAEWLLRGQGEMFKTGSEPKNTVSVGGSVLLSNVASEGATVGTMPKLVDLLDYMNSMVDKQSVNLQQRINDLQAALDDKRDEIIRLHNIINKLNK